MVAFLLVRVGKYLDVLSILYCAWYDVDQFDSFVVLGRRAERESKVPANRRCSGLSKKGSTGRPGRLSLGLSTKASLVP